jgi:hypothetical protein
MNIPIVSGNYYSQSNYLNTLTPSQLSQLQTLTSTQLNGAFKQTINNLTSSQIGNLSLSTLNNLTPGTISYFTSSQIQSLNPATLGQTNFTSLLYYMTSSQIQSLTQSQIAALSVDQINGIFARQKQQNTQLFSNEQIQYIPVNYIQYMQFENWNKLEVNSLSNSQILGLTQKQGKYFPYKFAG